MHELERLLALGRRAADAEDELDAVLAEAQARLGSEWFVDPQLEGLAAAATRNLRISRAPLN